MAVRSKLCCKGGRSVFLGLPPRRAALHGKIDSYQRDSSRVRGDARSARLRHPDCLLPFAYCLLCGRRCGDMKSPLHVHRCPEAFVEPVGEVGGAYDEHQLRNLFRVEVLAQGIEIGLLNRGRPSGEPLGKMNRSPFLIAENITSRPAGFLECLDLIVRHALSLRRSEVSARSIFAAVHNRSAEVSQLLELR